MEPFSFLCPNLIGSKQHQNSTKAGIIAKASADSHGLQDLSQVLFENKRTKDMGNCPNLDLLG